MPHTMKRIYLLLLPVLALVLVSCNDKAASTPILRAGTAVIRTSAAGVCDTISYLDTLSVADTARLQLVASGNLNALTSLVAKADTGCVQVALEWNPDYDSYLATGSDPEHGILKFVPEQVYAVQTALKYVPRKAGSHTINLVVASDAPAEYSPREYTFDIVVKE